MTKARRAPLPPVALLARWDGFCLSCRDDSRPLVLTWSGRRGLRAWLSGEGFTDGRLRLTCACCGAVDVVGWEDEPETLSASPAPEPRLHEDRGPARETVARTSPDPETVAVAPVAEPLAPAATTLPGPRADGEVVVADVMAELAALQASQVPSGPPQEAPEVADTVLPAQDGSWEPEPLSSAQRHLPSQRPCDGAGPPHPQDEVVHVSLDALLAGTATVVEPEPARVPPVAHQVPVEQVPEQAAAEVAAPSPLFALPLPDGVVVAPLAAGPAEAAARPGPVRVPQQPAPSTSDQPEPPRARAERRAAERAARRARKVPAPRTTVDPEALDLLDLVG